MLSTLDRNITEVLATDKEMGKICFRVLFCLMKYYNGSNWISIRQSLIAEKISAQKADVNRAIKKLSEKEYIISKKSGRSYMYQFNPDLDWSGIKGNDSIVDPINETMC